MGEIADLTFQESTIPKKETVSSATKKEGAVSFPLDPETQLKIEVTGDEIYIGTVPVGKTWDVNIHVVIYENDVE